MEVYIEDAPRERIKYCVRINVNGHDIFAKGNSLKEAYRECTNKARKMVKMDARKEAENAKKEAEKRKKIELLFPFTLKVYNYWSSTKIK